MISERISIRNDSGASFEDAKLKLVAGRSISREQVAYRPGNVQANGRCCSGPCRRAWSDGLPPRWARPVTLKDNQSKQLEFLKATEIAVEKQYIFEVTNFLRRAAP